jgi:hypothetical protein
MEKPVCIIGLDETEYLEIRKRVERPVMAQDTLPKIAVIDGELLVQASTRLAMTPVAKLVYHAIFENDMDFLTGLALWNGPTLPNAQAMMDCRLKLPCLARALHYTRFGSPARGYVAPGAQISVKGEYVAKWGNWHCGENKERFTGEWSSPEPCIIEPFFQGQAVRLLIIGERAWQIRLEGNDWLKSIHAPDAAFMEIDPELLEDADRVRKGFGLELIANDYIVGENGSRHLLEVNHIPNVTRFPEVWEYYRDYVVDWLNRP